MKRWKYGKNIEAHTLEIIREKALLHNKNTTYTTTHNTTHKNTRATSGWINVTKATWGSVSDVSFLPPSFLPSPYFCVEPPYNAHEPRHINL